MRRALVLLALAAACSQSHEITDTVSCPTLFDGTWSVAGVIGLPSEDRGGGCAEAWVGEVLVAQGPIAYDGSFALAFTVEGDLRDALVEVDVAGDLEKVRLGGAPEAVIDYDPGSLPLVERPEGQIELTGRLASTPDSTPIEEAWIVNWSAPRTAEVVPPPTLDEAFTARVPGSAGDHGAPVSRHVSAGAGGCWWPRGGGGVAACSDEEIFRGGCSGEPRECVEGRGCTPLAAPARRSGAPRHELPYEIPVHDGRPRRDGGHPWDGDGGPPS